MERVREIRASYAIWWWRWLVFPKSNSKNTVESIILMQRLDMTSESIKPSVSERPSCLVRAKVKCCPGTRTLQLPDHRKYYPRPTGGLISRSDERVLPICRGVIGVLYSPHQLKMILVKIIFKNGKNISWKFRIYAENMVIDICN